MWYDLRHEDCSSQKVILIYDNACQHKAQLIQTLLKIFCLERFEHPLYSADLVTTSDYHLFPWLKKELGGQHFQTREELEKCITDKLPLLLSS